MNVVRHGKSNEIDLLIFLFLPFMLSFSSSIYITLCRVVPLYFPWCGFYNTFYTANHFSLQPKVLVYVNPLKWAG
jgi:hypothetical protein